MSEKSFLVVGLGNIGPQYALTRHNIGFMILDAWVQASNVVFTTERYGDTCVIREKGREFHLLKPSTYMNLSGNAVRYWIQKLDIPLENVVILCDDLNLPFGSIRMRKAGSDGGHNGLKNIAELLETQEYARIRIGVGNDFERGGQIDYVLGRFSDGEILEIAEISKKIVGGLKTWSFIGIDKAMSQINTKKQPKPVSE